MMSRETLAARIAYYGGDQISRMNRQKLRSLQSALRNDYNSREIEVISTGKVMRALINKNNLKPDYDKEYVSVEFSSGLQAGDVFHVLDDDSYWMVYLPIITETAYLRAEIIKCRYQIDIEGRRYWIYFQGPTETDIRWNLKSNFTHNDLNYSGTIYMKSDEFTKGYFERFSTLDIDGHRWQVQVTDSISVPGVLELEVQEFYDNRYEDQPKVEQDEDLSQGSPIIGSVSVRHGGLIGYAITPEGFDPQAKWEISDNPRVRVEEVLSDGMVCTVRLLPRADKYFILKHGANELRVEIEPEEGFIHGPQTVYPYETCSYWTDEPVERFEIDNSLAKVMSSDDASCQVKIVSGKQGKFRIGCFSQSGEPHVLEVAIGSL